MPEGQTEALLTDSHAHLEMVAARLGEELLAALMDDWSAAPSGSGEGGGPPLILDPGVEPRDLGRRLALVRRLSGGGLPPFLRFAAGIWPAREALEAPEAALAALEAEIAAVLAGGTRIAAIGECGLDFHHHEGGPEAQARLFALQVRLAGRLGLPLIVHSRDAAAETLALLRAEAPSIPVLIHCFGYGPEEARAFLAEGFWVSFAGNLGYRKAEALRLALPLVPADRLLLETDAPYMNPEPGRGRPSSPRDVVRTYAVAATLRGVTVKSLAASVSANAARLFG